jgi:hypothetical protein
MKNIKFVAVLFLAFLTACAESASNTDAYSARNGSIDQTASIKSEEIGGGGGGGRTEPLVQQISLTQAEQTQTEPVVVERKIIRNADLQLEADAPEEAQAKITQIAESKSGFVVESMQSSSDAKTTKRDTVTMTVRVPSAKFDEALNEIRSAASRVIVESVKGEDVTEEFIDIEARLKTQKALEVQFLEIMKRSNSVEDALNVQTEIARVRGEIEKIEGRKRFLESQASLSIIKIKLQTPAVFSANSSGFYGRLAEAFGNGFDAALSFVLVFVTALTALLPFLLLIVLPIYLVIRYLLRKNRKRQTAGEIAREEIKTE